MNTAPGGGALDSGVSFITRQVWRTIASTQRACSASSDSAAGVRAPCRLSPARPARSTAPDGQRVDASAARFQPPELAAGLAGAYVDIEGTLENGVLRASAVSDP